jgi:hypothetical protein
VFKYFAVVTFAILLATSPAMAGSLFDTGPRSNPATNRCDLYDPNCKPRQLFARPPEPSTKSNPLGNPAPKLILPRDLNDRSGNPSSPLLLPSEPNSRLHRRLACREARLVIRYKGYRNIRTVKCGGIYHYFTAQRRGSKYPVNLKVRATTGKIVVEGRSR